MLWAWILVIIIVLVIAAEFAGWRNRRAAGAYPPRGEFVRVDGFNFHYVSKGSGPCVILFHGTAGSLEDYPPSVFEALARDFRVVAIDRPGHGHSERPPAADTPLAQARILRKVCQKLGCGRAIVVGHSWSGAAALAFALENPADTRGVLLLQGTIYRQASTVTPIVRLLASPLLGPILARTLIPLAGARAIGQTLERAFHPDSVPAEYLKRAQVMWTRPGQARAIALDTMGRDRSIEELCGRYRRRSRRRFFSSWGWRTGLFYRRVNRYASSANFRARGRSLFPTWVIKFQCCGRKRWSTPCANSSRLPTPPMPDLTTVEASRPRATSRATELWWSAVAWSETEEIARRQIQVSLGVLSPEETERADRYDEPRRTEFVMARAALRQMLARFTGRLPAEFEFSQGPNNRPVLSDGSIRFSVAHTRGLAVLAVCGAGEIGIDVERIRPVLERGRLADDYCSESEAKEMRQVAVSDADEAFLRHWTRREAILKAWDASADDWAKLREINVDRADASGSMRASRGSESLGVVRTIRPADGFIGAVATRESDFGAVIRISDPLSWEGTHDR